MMDYRNEMRANNNNKKQNDQYTHQHLDLKGIRLECSQQSVYVGVCVSIVILLLCASRVIDVDCFKAALSVFV